MRAVINVGHATGKGHVWNDATVLAAIVNAGLHVQLDTVRVLPETDERERCTACAVTLSPASPFIAYECLMELCRVLDQECIAYYGPEGGALIGPCSKAWEPFDPTAFVLV